jgi:hypothetical protein
MHSHVVGLGWGGEACLLPAVLCLLGPTRGGGLSVRELAVPFRDCSDVVVGLA